MTLLQQANAYRMLANGGRFTPLRIRKGDPAPEPRAVFSRQAAFLAADMMADPGARAVTFGLDSALRLVNEQHTLREVPAPGDVTLLVGLLFGGDANDRVPRRVRVVP